MICNNCGKDIKTGSLTLINAEGGYGRPQFLACDKCMENDFIEWRKLHWPDWPNNPPPINDEACNG
jgi:hypothetical protein